MSETVDHQHDGRSPSGFQPGDVVDITIKGVRVVRDSVRGASVQLDTHQEHAVHTLPLDLPGLTVERVAPAEWPPQPGDVWRDKDGTPWFAVGSLHSEEREPVLLTCNGRNRRQVEDIRDLYSPLTLVHRETAR